MSSIRTAGWITGIRWARASLFPSFEDPPELDFPEDYPDLREWLQGFADGMMICLEGA